MAGTNNPFRLDDREPWPIGANTGGPIDPNDHIGHLDELSAALAATVGPNNVGVLLHGDRRMGKTSLLHLIERYLAEQDIVTIRVSAETSDPTVFATRLREALYQASFLRAALDKVNVDLGVTYEGITLRTMRRSVSGGKPSETDDLFDFAVKNAGSRKVVVILDEITVLASAFAKNDPNDAMEFFRSLRAARQRHPEQLAMILSGSIGLHHVIPDMSGVNDLTAVRVSELTAHHGVFLARCLLLGEQIESNDPIALAEAISASAGHAAFYIHHLVRLAGRSGRPVTAAEVELLLATLMTDPDDPCDFRHYRDRLGDYYGTDAPVGGAILDVFAQSPHALKIAELVDLLAAVDLDPRPDRNALVLLVEKLERDNYLVRSGETTVFSSRVLQRAWRSIRRLG